MKWIATPLAGLFTLLFVLIAILAATGLFKFYAPRGSPAPNITVEQTQERVARGEHLASAFCAECHSSNGELPLGGGEDVAKKSPVPIGLLVPYNLTPGGPIKDWSDGEIFRALREGVDREGHPLLAMQGLAFRNLSDDDIQAVIAYLRSQEAMTNPAGGDAPNIVFAIFTGAGLVPNLNPIRGSVTVVAKGPTPGYGKYIVSVAGCRDCHGPNLTGGTGGLTPIGPNIVAITANWKPDGFTQAMRTGVDPAGHAISTAMPWKSYGKLDDEELAALLAYLQSLK
jgi:mono/diheme cytochrome c family protein